MRVPADVAADASVRMLGAGGLLEPEPGTAGLLAALTPASPLPAGPPLPAEPIPTEPIPAAVCTSPLAAAVGATLLPAPVGATPSGAETGAAARSKWGAKTAVLPASAVAPGVVGFALGSAPAAPAGRPGMAPAASAAWAAAKRSVFTAGGEPEGASPGGDAGTGGG